MISEHRIGITPILKRLAWYYVKRGIGSHEIEHGNYDEVIVRELYSWETTEDYDGPTHGGLVVEFMQLGRRIRWVEFGVYTIGGGGEPILQEVNEVLSLPQLLQRPK